MNKKAFCLAILLFSNTFLHGSSIQREHYRPSTDTTELLLSNGMTVVLKPTQLKEKEVVVNVTALNGYSNLLPELQPAARIAHEFVWNDGIGGLAGDKLSQFLTDNGLDLEFDIGPGRRSIVGEGSSLRANQLLKLVHDLFTMTKLNPDHFIGTKSAIKRDLLSLGAPSKSPFDQSYLSVNTNGFKPLNPLTYDEIQKVTFDQVSSLFGEAFANPSDFVAVIVGDFDSSKLRTLVEMHLATIPVSKRVLPWNEENIPAFPKGIITRTEQSKAGTQQLTRVSFPVIVPMDRESVALLSHLVKVMESRLKERFQARYGNSFKIQVSSEFPVYPSLQSPWIVVEFSADDQLTPRLISMAMNQINDLRKSGPTELDVENASKLQEQKDALNNKTNAFWVSQLLNFYLLDWDPDLLMPGVTAKSANSSELRNSLRDFFPMDNYTVVSGAR